MNSKGFGYAGWFILILLAVMFIPFGLFELFPYTKWLFIMLIGLGLYNFVLQYLGEGYLSIAVAGILTIIAVKYLWISVPLYMLMLLAGMYLLNFIGVLSKHVLEPMTSSGQHPQAPRMRPPGM